MLFYSFGAIRWLLWGMLCIPAFGQIAKEIPPGTSADAVIRAYGWPKGRAAAGDREIWTFEEFQVTLVKGRVLSVSALPPSSTGPAGARASVPRATTASAPPAIPARPSGQTKKMSAAAFAEEMSRKPGYVLQEATPVVRSPAPASVVGSTRADETLKSKAAVTAPKRELSPKGAAAAPSGSLGWFSLLVWVMLPIIFALAVAKQWAARKRGIRTGKPHAAPETIAGQAPRREPANWKEEIADRLARSKALAHSQAANESAASSRPDDVLREVALQSGDLSRELLLALEWKRFELFTALYFGTTGLRAELTSSGADGGVDVKLYREGDAHTASLVQCKAWGTDPIGVALVRELRGVMAAERVAQGVFVTTSDFTSDARAFAVANDILPLNTKDLVERFQQLTLEARRRILTEVTVGDYLTPTCPTCDIKLVLRESGKEGKRFWGCTRYPRCTTRIYPRATAASDARPVQSNGDRS